MDLSLRLASLWQLNSAAIVTFVLRRPFGSDCRRSQSIGPCRERDRLSGEELHASVDRAAVRSYLAATVRAPGDLLEGAIARGDLPSGSRLPPERELASRLRISRTTVVSAYRELESRGLLRGYVGRGTFVCASPEPTGAPFAWRGKIAAAALRSSDSTLRDTIRHSSDARLVSLAAGEPAIDCFPTAAFRRRSTRCCRAMRTAAWRHGPTEGQPVLREAIAERFGVPAESVLVIAGAQQGLDLLARCLIDPGDAVIIDRPGYLGAIQSFHAAGAKLIGWDIARADIDELEDLLVRYRPKLIYTNPTFQNPTGVDDADPHAA